MPASNRIGIVLDAVGERDHQQPRMMSHHIMLDHRNFGFRDPPGVAPCGIRRRAINGVIEPGFGDQRLRRSYMASAVYCGTNLMPQDGIRVARRFSTCEWRDSKRIMQPRRNQKEFSNGPPRTSIGP